MTIRVLVADDEALLRTAFTSLIEAEEDLHVVGEAADGKQAVELAARLAPDVVLMDVRMPVLDGIEATRLITGAGTVSTPRVLILTTFIFPAVRLIPAGTQTPASPRHTRPAVGRSRPADSPSASAPGPRSTTWNCSCRGAPRSAIWGRTGRARLR